MPKMVANENRKLFYVPSIADYRQPTVAELAAGLDISMLVTAADFSLGATGEEAITDPPLNAGGNDSSPGRTTYESGMNFYRWTTTEEDKAWDTFNGAGLAGYLVQRIGKDYRLPWAAGEEVQVYDTLTGRQQILSPPSGSGFEKFRQMFYVQSSRTDERAVVKAAA